MQSWDIQSSKGSIKKIAIENRKRQPLYHARELETKQNFLDITALIRSLQRSEGEEDCFRTSDINCRRTDCRWREYCFDK